MLRDVTCYLICSRPIDLGIKNKLIWVICWMVKEIMSEIIDEISLQE
jgi:hypothetical protein